MAEVIRLATNQPKPARACATCRYHERSYVHRGICGATGIIARIERNYPGPCGPAGLMWESRSPRTPGIFERAWRFLFGGR